MSRNQEKIALWTLVVTVISTLIALLGLIVQRDVLGKTDQPISGEESSSRISDREKVETKGALGGSVITVYYPSFLAGCSVEVNGISPNIVGQGVGFVELSLMAGNNVIVLATDGDRCTKTVTIPYGGDVLNMIREDCQ